MPSSLIHCAKFKTPSSKVTCSIIVVEDTLSSSETTPLVSSSPIVQAETNRARKITFLLLPLVVFLMPL